MTWKYDERGNTTEEAYFGVDGKPALHKYGYAGWRAVYNERHIRVAYTLFDVDGEVIQTVHEQTQP